MKILLISLLAYISSITVIAIPCSPDLSEAAPYEAAEFSVEYVNKVAPNSSTRNLLRKPARITYVNGKWIGDGPIANTISQYRKEIAEKILENPTEYNTLPIFI